MKKLLIVLFFVFSLFLFNTKNIFGDYAATYQSYITLSDLYRKSYQSYISSKNKFLTYHTLTSENEAIENGRNFLKTRDQFLLQYLKLLNDRTSETGGFSQSERDLIFSKLNVESVWLYGHRSKYDTAGSLNDLQRVSDQLQDRYGSVIRYVALQTAGTIIHNKTKIFINTIDDILLRIDTVLKQMGEESFDVSLAQRWLLEAQNKVSLSKEKQDDANSIFTNLHGQNLVSDYNKAVFLLNESNQYLREASLNISEIIRIIKGE
jgi:hypothetical protein